MPIKKSVKKSAAVAKQLLTGVPAAAGQAPKAAAKAKKAVKPVKASAAKKVAVVTPVVRAPKVEKVETKPVSPSVAKQLLTGAPATAGRAETYFYASGKRKTAIARVRLFRRKGTTGKNIVNEKPLEVYFPTGLQQQVINSPLKITNLVDRFDISVLVTGGGPNSQAEAVRHGVSWALLDYDPGLRPTLKRAGFLTRDARSKERKKYGLKRARRAPQFSKR